jgi:adenylate kinase
MIFKAPNSCCISVSGVQGSGKSFLCSKIKTYYDQLTVATRCYGDVMTRFMAAGEHDEIPFLNDKELSVIYPKASALLERYIRFIKADLILLQNHLSVRQGQKKFDRPEKFSRFYVQGFIVIEPPPKLVLCRKIRDTDRSRPDVSRETIERHQKINHRIAEGLAKEMDVPLLFVDNRNLDITIRKCVDWLDSHFLGRLNFK